jgi:hypothetical protein
MYFDNFHLPTIIVSRWNLRVRKIGPPRGVSKQFFQVLNRACHGFRASDGSPEAGLKLEYFTEVENFKNSPRWPASVTAEVASRVSSSPPFLFKHLH